MKKTVIAVLASLMIFLPGCSTYRTPGTGSLPISELGILEHDPHEPKCIWITQIDGKWSGIGFKRRYELKPGEHSITAAYSCDRYHSGNITRWINVRPGGEYKFQSGLDTITKKVDITILNKVTGKRIDFTYPPVSNIPEARQYLKKGMTAVRNGDYAKAIEYYTKAIEIDKKCQQAYAIRGAIYGKTRQFAQSISDLNKAIEINPNDDLSFSNRGRVYIFLKQYDKALLDLEKAIEHNPKQYLAYMNLGLIYGSKGENNLAIKNISKAIEINPYYRDGYIWRGLIYTVKKKWYDKALSDFSKAIEIDPTYGPAYNVKSWILATCPDTKYRDGKEALKLAQKSVEIHRNCVSLKHLAAGYAELGDFKQAVSAQEESIRLLNSKKCTQKNTTIFYEQLESYKKGRPWRD